MAELSKDEKIIIQQARDFQDLIAHPGFKLLGELIQKRIQAETLSLIGPTFADGVDGIKLMKVEDRQKGAMYGMLFTIGLPQRTIDQSKDILTRKAEDSSEPATKDTKNVKAP